MPGIPLRAWDRYLPAGLRKIYWVAAIANTAAPTFAELNLGIDLSPQVAGVSGFALPRDTADITPLGSRIIVLQNTTFNPGSTSEIILYASSDSNDMRMTMDADSAGFLVFFPEGNVTGRRCDVWPATVNTNYPESDIETPGQFHVQFTITDVPAQNAPIP